MHAQFTLGLAHKAARHAHYQREPLDLHAYPEVLLEHADGVSGVRLMAELAHPEGPVGMETGMHRERGIVLEGSEADVTLDAGTVIWSIGKGIHGNDLDRRWSIHTGSPTVSVTYLMAVYLFLMLL